MEKQSNLSIVSFSNEKIYDVIDSLKDTSTSIIITNLNGNILFVNKIFEDRTGHFLSEIKGKNPRFLKSDETNPEKYKKLWDTILSGKIWSGEFKNRKKNGDFFWEYSTIHPIKDKNNKITHFLAIKEDITQIKLLEELLNSSIEKDNLKEIKFEFLRQISHEIQNPVNVILSFVEILKTKCKSDGCLDCNIQDPYFDIIIEQANRLLKLTEMLINISEIKTEITDFKLNILSQDFLNSLIAEIKEPVPTILGTMSLLKLECIKKNETEYVTGFNAISISCSRIVTTWEIIYLCSRHEDDEISFCKNVIAKISEEKEKFEKLTSKVITPPRDIKKIIENHLEDNKYGTAEESTPPVPALEVKIDIDSTPFIFNRNEDLLIEAKEFDGIKLVFFNTFWPNLTQVREFKEYLISLISSGQERIIIDISRCNKIDASFAGSLFIVKKAINKINGKIVLVFNPKFILINSFAMINIELIFDLYPDLKSAITALTNNVLPYNAETKGII